LDLWIADKYSWVWGICQLLR